MTFTDEDLKRLKEDLKKRTGENVLCRYLTYDDVDALLLRLEAAENCITKHVVDEWIDCGCMKEWRKAAGKDSKE